MAEDATPNQVIDRYQVPRKMAHLVLVNGLYVDPGQRDAGGLRDGDVLAIWRIHHRGDWQLRGLPRHV